MKRKFFIILLSCCMLLGAIPAAATESTEPTNVPRAPGYCGESIAWEYSEGTLTITGMGQMDDFPEGAPWEEHKEDLEKVIISGGITYVGAYAFCDYDNLKTVEFGKDLYEIGERAFFSCDGLTVVHLPESFRVFGPSSFMGCTALTEFHCQGRFPSFRQNCLWDTYAKIYFPAEKPWGVEYIRDLEEAFKGRIEFLASDGTDPYVPTEPTEPDQEPTEPATEEPTTVPPTTVPPTTEAPTQEPTQAPTEPPVTQSVPTETEEATEQETAAAPTESQPATEPEEETSGGKTGFIIIGAVGVFLVLGSLIFGGGRKRGKYSR